MSSTVDGEQNTITAKLIIRALPQPWNQRVQIVFLDGLLQLISFSILTCIQMVTLQKLQSCQGCLFCRWYSSCQERMYRTCTKMSGHSTQKTEEEVPGLGGKGKLTNATIDKLHNYYGIEITGWYILWHCYLFYHWRMEWNEKRQCMDVLPLCLK